jgi:hypothetical protein
LEEEEEEAAEDNGVLLDDEEKEEEIDPQWLLPTELSPWARWFVREIFLGIGRPVGEDCVDDLAEDISTSLTLSLDAAKEDIVSDVVVEGDVWSSSVMEERFTLVLFCCWRILCSCSHGWESWNNKNIFF